MLPKTLGYLLQRSRYKWESGEQNQTSHWALWRSSHHCEETKTEMVWAQNKINRTCKDDPTGHCTRREKERQTEKEMGRQHNGVDRIKVGWSPSKGRKQRRMENSGCPIILGAQRCPDTVYLKLQTQCTPNYRHSVPQTTDTVYPQTTDTVYPKLQTQCTPNYRHNVPQTTDTVYPKLQT